MPSKGDFNRVTRRTRETQYQRTIELADAGVTASLGLMTNQVWRDDPKRLTFMLARYKFVAKMFAGMARVLEVGCGDAFATRLVAQTVGKLTATDFDPVFVNDAIERQDGQWPFDCKVHDILSGPFGKDHDGVYSLDVLEHIAREQESLFIGNVAESLRPDGVFIVGTPSLESQQYASAPSRAGHVNCKSEPELRLLTEQFFSRVFVFSMNDEVVHTGYYPMAHYLFAVCCGRKQVRKGRTIKHHST